MVGKGALTVLLRSLEIGLIGMLWGGGVLLARLARGASDVAADEAYAFGQLVGLVFEARRACFEAERRCHAPHVCARL